MKKVNKNKLIIVFAILLIIIVIAITVIILKSKPKEEEISKTERDMSLGEFKSEIDIYDTSNCTIREDGMKVNTSSEIAKGLEFNDFFVEDIRIESTGDMATFNAIVHNNSEKDVEGYIIYLMFYRKNGSLIGRVETYFPDMPSGEIGFITATTPKDIATAYRMEIETEKKE